jgi:GTP-binding protein HflX
LEKVREQLEVHQERAVLVGVLQRGDFKTANFKNMDVRAELTALSESAGAIVVDRLIQRINTIHPATYIGSGKAKELAEKVRDKKRR